MEKAEGKVASGQPFGNRLPHDPASPNDAHPVGTDDIAFGRCPPERLVAPHSNQLGDIHVAMLETFSALHCPHKKALGFLHRQSIDRTAEKFDALRALGFHWFKH
jgi:hypothetical protein